MEHFELWFKFTVAALIVVAAGLSLTKNAEKLATAMGWGHAFAGFVILGWATSLPEVTISVSAVTEVGSAALSVGNITGSVIFNLAILAILELIARKQRSTSDSSDGITALGLFNLVLIGGMLAVMWRPQLASGAMSQVVGILLVGGYVVTTAHAWFSQKAESGDTEGQSTPLPWAIIGRCLLAGSVILAMGIWLSHLGEELATTYNLDEGLVGTLFLACVSSLPELVTGLGAVKLGLLTMATASILGSNIFNLGILGVCDLLYQSGVQAGVPIVVAAETPRLTGNVVAALGMTFLALMAVRMRSNNDKGQLVRVCVASGMLIIYFVALI
ncbi:MAG: cation:H+ antiporter [Pseudohongiellaceae bacterium]|jgi:cation:H+ antiporter